MEQIAMKKALICPNESKLTGYRVAQVEEVENIFPVADPLYWTDCDDQVVADQYWFDPIDSTLKEIPVETVQPIGDAPNVIA
jgi:hypothetical protein